MSTLHDLIFGPPVRNQKFPNPCFNSNKIQSQKEPKFVMVKRTPMSLTRTNENINCKYHKIQISFSKALDLKWIFKIDMGLTDETDYN